MQVTILFQVRRTGIGAGRLRRAVSHVLRRERAPRGSWVTIVLTSDEKIRMLNRRYLRRNRPTDVLAFPSHGRPADVRMPPAKDRRGRPDRGMLGEVVVAVPRARVQAKTAGHDVATEVALLAAHGVLHLLGYDDRTSRLRHRMMRRQQALLAEVGMKVRG